MIDALLISVYGLRMIAYSIYFLYSKQCESCFLNKEEKTCVCGRGSWHSKEK